MPLASFSDKLHPNSNRHNIHDENLAIEYKNYFHFELG